MIYLFSRLGISSLGHADECKSGHDEHESSHFDVLSELVDWKERMNYSRGNEITKFLSTELLI